jgi:hypothetical protein
MKQLLGLRTLSISLRWVTCGPIHTWDHLPVSTMWSADPFGHSTSHASLPRQMASDGFVIGRPMTAGDPINSATAELWHPFASFPDTGSYDDYTCLSTTTRDIGSRTETHIRHAAWFSECDSCGFNHLRTRAWRRAHPLPAIFWSCLGTTLRTRMRR